MKNRMRKVLGILASAILVMIGASRPSQILCTWPKPLFWVTAHTSVSVPWSRWLPIEAEASNSPVEIDHQRNRTWISLGQNAWHFSVHHTGIYRLKYRVLGVVPWGSSWVQASAPLWVAAGGQSIGIVIHTQGLILRAFQPVRQGSGADIDPAKRAGLEVGDVIAAANGRAIKSLKSFDRQIEQAGRARRALVLSVVGQSSRIRRVTPVWQPAHHRYAIGAVLSDGLSGVGTLTYFDPKTGRFGALGHSMSDGVTRIPVAISSGVVMGANVVGVVSSRVDDPGEKIGVLAKRSEIAGRITANGAFGIHGRLVRWPKGAAIHRVPVAYPDDIQPGPATLVTVLHGQRTSDYGIRILRAYRQRRARTKGILFEVTDPRLLRTTGGIVQGMSGSPILQDGRLVGAVTHVMVGRPWLGYGCYAVWMMGDKSQAG